MGFVSYAQNFEDVMLWRALKHVAAGFYIDVGANDPEIDSVTKAFYDRGWNGINIEPIPQWFERLRHNRPRDTNLQIAAGASKGEITIFELPDTGLSTIDPATAERHELERGYNKKKLLVPVDTLTAICAEHCVDDIHFLKIDVEGGERDVLEGLNLQTIRPWIILIESTLPNTQIENHADWENLIVQNGYEFVYFDGLNRFYLASEHQSLRIHFRAPPNVFDEMVPRQTVEADARIAEAESTNAELTKRLLKSELRINHLCETEARLQIEVQKTAYQLEAVELALQGVLKSRSWAVTAPLRWLSLQAQLLLKHGLRSRAKAFLRKLLHGRKDPDGAREDSLEKTSVAIQTQESDNASSDSELPLKAESIAGGSQPREPQKHHRAGTVPGMHEKRKSPLERLIADQQIPR